MEDGQDDKEKDKEQRTRDDRKKKMTKRQE